MSHPDPTQTYDDPHKETTPASSPLPWTYSLSTVYTKTIPGPLIDENEKIICSVINKPDAKFIVDAVNAYGLVGELVDMLETTYEMGVRPKSPVVLALLTRAREVMK